MDRADPGRQGWPPFADFRRARLRQAKTRRRDAPPIADGPKRDGANLEGIAPDFGATRFYRGSRAKMHRVFLKPPAPSMRRGLGDAMESGFAADSEPSRQARAKVRCQAGTGPGRSPWHWGANGAPRRRRSFGVMRSAVPCLPTLTAEVRLGDGKPVSFSTGRGGGSKSGGSASKGTGSTLSREWKRGRMRLKPAAPGGGTWGIPVKLTAAIEKELVP